MTAVLDPPATAAETLERIPLDDLHPSPDNPRRDVGDVEELAKSIAELGVIEPLVVTPAPAGGYVVIAGHRRLAACLKAKVLDAPCIVRADVDDTTARAMRVVENLHREDLSALEEAGAYAELAKLGQSQRDIAKLVSRSQPHISRRMALLKLPEAARAALDAGRITVEEAGQLAALPAKDVETLFKGGKVPAEWAIEEAVRRHEMAGKRAAASKELEASGATVLEQALAGYQHSLGQTWGVLADLSLEDHTGEPCHAGAVDHSGRIVWQCTEPIRHQPGGDSALQVPEETDEDDEPEEPTDDPVEQAAREARRAEQAAESAARDERKARRQQSIDARRAFVKDLVDGADATTAVELVTLMFHHCGYVEDFYDRQTAGYLGIEPDTFTRTPAHEQVRAYTEKGGRNRARALVAGAATMFEASITPGLYQLADERIVVVDEEEEEAAVAWLSWLASRGYELSEHDRELLPEVEPESAENEAPARSTEAVMPTITTAKAGKRWKVTCSACGDIGHNTTGEYAAERGRTHLDLDHALVDAEVSP